MLLLRVTAKQYADAARQFRDGNLKVNPPALALADQSTYKLSSFTSKRIKLTVIATGRRYSGSVPAVLADYLAGFRRGVRVSKPTNSKWFSKVTPTERVGPAANQRESKVKILLDHVGMTQLIFAWETSDYCLHYVAAEPVRVIVAFPNGLEPELLTGAVVEAQSGEGLGLAGRVRAGNVGQLHTKIVIVERVNGPPDTTLSQMLANGLQDGE